LGQKYGKLSADVSKESRESKFKDSKESKSEDSEEPDNIDAEDEDLGDYDIIFQDLSVVDATAADLSNLT
jgi:hypothetical protein